MTRPAARMGRRAFLTSLVGPLVLGETVLIEGRHETTAHAAPVTEELLRELDTRRAESLLLHRKVDLTGLRLLHEGQLVNGSAPPVSRLLILNIWAVECRPCVEEFPILRRIADSLHDMPQVKFVLVTETLDAVRLQRFFSEHRGDLPRVEQYQSTDDKLRGSLQNRSQPVTLLLDALGVVRQAFLGTLRQRRSEFADAILRLSRSV